MSGSGWGNVVFVPLAQKMLEKLSWRTTLRILAPVMGALFLLAGSVLRYPAAVKAERAALRAKRGHQKRIRLDCQWWSNQTWLRWTLCSILQQCRSA